MAKYTFSKYALGVAAAAMITVPTAGVAGAIPIIPNGSSSSNSAEPNPEAGSDSGAISGVGNTGSESDSETSGESKSGSTSGSGSNITSTVTTTTTPAPEDDEVTLDEPTQEDPAPAEENLAVTGSSTQFFAGTLAVLTVLAAGGYVFAMRRASSV